MPLCSIFNQLKQAYLVINLDDWLPVVVNSAAAQLLAEDLDSLPQSELWQGSLVPLLNDHHQVDDPVFYHRKTLFQLNCSKVKESGCDYLVLNITKATPSKEQLHNLFSLLDNLGAYVYCKDKNYRYTFVNRQVCELFSCEPEQIIGKDDSALFDSATAQRLIKESDQFVINDAQTIEKEEVNFLPHLNEQRHYLSVKKPLFDDLDRVSGLFGISTDITELKQTQQKLYESEQRLSTILDNVGAYIFIKDSDCRFCYINKKTEELLQCSSDSVMGLNNFEMFDQEQAEEFEETDRQVFANGQRIDCLECLNLAGDIRYYWTVKIPLQNDQGEIDRYIGISTDITEQKRLEYQVRESNRQLQNQVDEISRLRDELHIQATHDALTGLYNRRFLEEHAHLAFTDSQRGAASILMLDVDHFKSVNDSLGHKKGDEVLQLLAGVLREECRANDLVCRYGGEEFLILLPNAEIDVAYQKAEWIRKRYQKSVEQKIPDAKGSTVSIGVAASPNSGKDFISVYQAADKALYRAKKEGRNRSIRAEG